MAERIPALRPEPVAPRRRGGTLLGIVIALFAIALIVLFFHSSLSRITDIEITGTRYAAAADVEQALGIQEGDSFFKGSPKKLEAKIEEIGPVQNATVTKRFPGHLKIEVQEFAAVAVELNDTGRASLVLENGLSIPMKEGESLPDMPILTGWNVNDPNRAALCGVLGKLEPAALGDFSQIAPDPSNAYPDRIKLFTRSKFEIVTTIGKLPGKMDIMGEIVANRAPGLITLLEADYYLPYSAQNEQQSGS
ncbi:FtsQ-type POTRA domain-containing protein [Cohnella lubricantis]|uniref:FtsQ-type POTRA domain-containing protein n=1 Tax=Cohnella lubricantis TaxID=2163172 RepID=A0A841TB50_9BACL|nr:FtsQ-type POTRA domain-containing protein [Cohnella lubricantis]MBB6677316.1 FtsQ-type POTRA domain-containing protein [Cohnella lubricantis]MBP2116872.1 cell division protein FtsQ [Cohnella lubricantis]